MPDLAQARWISSSPLQLGAQYSISSLQLAIWWPTFLYIHPIAPKTAKPARQARDSPADFPRTMASPFSPRSLARSWITRLALKHPTRDSEWLNQCYSRHDFRNAPDSVSLDLGSGPNPRNPFNCHKVLGIDIRASESVLYCDLSRNPIPLSSQSVSAVSAYDFLEHVPRAQTIYTSEDGDQSRLPFIELLNEIYRVLKPGGLFFSRTPCYPWPMAFSDPTHVNIMTEETLLHYFCEPKKWGAIYGFTGSFEFMEAAWIDCHHHILMRK